MMRHSALGKSRGRLGAGVGEQESRRARGWIHSVCERQAREREQELSLESRAV